MRKVKQIISRCAIIPFATKRIFNYGD